MDRCRLILFNFIVAIMLFSVATPLQGIGVGDQALGGIILRIREFDGEGNTCVDSKDRVDRQTERAICDQLAEEAGFRHGIWRVLREGDCNFAGELLCFNQIVCPIPITDPGIKHVYICVAG